MSVVNLEDVPVIGLGTWENSDYDQCVRTVREALEIGYRHLDTAQLYENEDAVGEGIEESAVDRDEIFLATKVSFENLRPEEVVESTRSSLQKLRTEYVDLLYVHWPAGDYEASATLKAFEKLRAEDAIRFIGVSNYTPELLAEARDVLAGDLYAHQIEMHPLLQQDELHGDARENDTRLVAYSPFRHGTLFDETLLEEIAEDHGISVAQVCLAWLLEKESVHPIPKATGRDHLLDNFRASEVTLDDEALALIDGLERNDRYIDPPFAPDWS